jgi:hypothetical protein
VTSSANYLLISLKPLIAPAHSTGQTAHRCTGGSTPSRVASYGATYCSESSAACRTSRYMTLRWHRLARCGVRGRGSILGTRRYGQEQERERCDSKRHSTIAPMTLPKTSRFHSFSSMGNPGHKTDPEFNPESLGTVMLIKFGDAHNLFASLLKVAISSLSAVDGRASSRPAGTAVVTLEA